MKDLFGRAMLDYFTDNDPGKLITETSISEEDEVEISYLLRKYEDMPEIEKQALKLCRGKILDAGCGGGSHSVHLQEKGFEVLPIDISPAAIEVCKGRGLKDAMVADIFTISGQYDTILLMMNGIGICGLYENLAAFLKNLRRLLRPGGQVLLDSSDLIYMFDVDEDGGVWIPTDRDYYGEVSYTIHYKGSSETIDWLYLDFDTLQKSAIEQHFQCELIAEGNNFDFLARLTV